LATLTELASRTLGFARSPSTTKRIEMSLLIEAALRIHQRRIVAKHVELTKELALDLIVDVYTGEILQVVSNLVRNALDALPQGGKLRVRARKRGGNVLVVVADNGSGIPEDRITQLFRPFFTTKENGNGLGLALSKEIMNRHGGHIRMRSCVRSGRSGTAFGISLPA